MNEKRDCIHYSEVQDMNATVPCCDFYEFGNTPCKDCKRYYSKKDLVAVVRCKDCKHSKYREDYDDYECEASGCGIVNNADFYCADGERKETND